MRNKRIHQSCVTIVRDVLNLLGIFPKVQQGARVIANSFTTNVLK